MGGIYIHIPFCHKACHYCDFHFSTQLGYVDDMVDAICDEIKIKKDRLKGPIETVYFGGGTPSLLSITQLSRILNSVYKYFEIAGNAEITLEANPEDIEAKKGIEWKRLGINRLSIGIQTFDEDRLRFLNRNHSAQQAEECVHIARGFGIENMSLDLIYAIPPADIARWERDLRKVLSLDVPHLSVYGLTIEEKTVFGKWHEKGRLEVMDENDNEAQYSLAEKILTENGYHHYEVSNYGKEGFYSQHNTSYWLQKHYLGIGPGAHGYDGDQRYINVSNNHLYIKALEEGKLPEEVEHLSSIQKLNEYVMTRIRTLFGIDLEEIKTNFNIDFGTEKKPILDFLLSKEMAKHHGNALVLTTSGMKLADEIALKLFYDS